LSRARPHIELGEIRTCSHPTVHFHREQLPVKIDIFHLCQFL
jgi:hypothetical protein